MTNLPENNLDRKIPDKPLECSECKKPIAVLYTEIVGNSMTHVSHCADCPILQKKLHGIRKHDLEGGALEGGAGLCCGNCGTTLEAIQMGTPLGCTTCYEVFGDLLVTEMLEADQISHQSSPTKNTAALHMGRAPGESAEITPSSRLMALNEALNETLRREDYEQAAWLRDQIKELTDKEKENG